MVEHGAGDVLTIDEAAERVGLQPESLLRYVRAGKLSAVQVEREYTVSLEDLENFDLGRRRRYLLVERRTAHKAIKSAVPDLSTDSNGRIELTKISAWVISQFEKPANLRTDIASRTIANINGGISICFDLGNPAYGGHYPPAEYSIYPFVLYGLGFDPRKATVVNPRKGLDRNQNLVLIGGPVTNRQVQYIFEYYQKLRRAKSPLFDFRYSWQTQADRLSEMTRFGYSHPNWSILDNREKGILEPVIENGRVKKDYLLITRIRNFLNRGSFEGGQSLTIMGGTHAEGTSGISQLFTDFADLWVQKLASIGNPLEYQALFEVEDMEYYQVIDEGRPRKIKCLDIVAVHIHPRAYEIRLNESLI